MSDRYREGIDDQAAAWVARMDADRWTDADELQLQDWLSADYRRRGALLQAQAAWSSLAFPADAAAGAVPPPSRPGRRPISRRGVIAAGGVLGGAIAASVAGGLIWFGPGTTYSTGMGEIRKIPLEDGSTATINSASRMNVVLAERRREVRLTRGEAWFQVAKDARRPFLVEAGEVTVRAVGTAFAVRRRDGGADILVTEGVVEAWTRTVGGRRLRLTAGQRAFVGDDGRATIASDTPSGVDRALAWRGGSIDLNGQSLAEAIAEFNRYNRRRLVLADAALAQEQFDGVFRTDDPEGFAVAVRDSLHIPVDLADPAVIRIGASRRKT